MPPLLPDYYDASASVLVPLFFKRRTAEEVKCFPFIIYMHLLIPSLFKPICLQSHFYLQL